MPTTQKLLTAAAGSAGGTEGYVEDVFSTYLYTGTGSAITVNNGIDLSGEGGLTWLKSRSLAEAHILMDTARGVSSALVSSNSNAAFALTDGITAFNSNGFTLGTSNITNTNASTNVSWSFRKAKKFFDVVSWVGSNNSSTDIGKGIVPHNLGVAPALVLVKNTTQASTNWIVYHKDQTTGYYSVLNSTAAQTNSGSVAYFSKHIDGVGWQQTNPDADNIYIGYNYQTNGNTDTLVAYLFASDAGGYGDAGDENIIKCGTYVGNGTTPGVVVATGFEPQFVLVKPATTTGPWSLIDNMRGWTADSVGDKWFEANTNGAEYASEMMDLTATGFTTRGNYSSTNSNGQTYIYMAVRRPMKPPTAGTEVFVPVGATTTAPLWKSSFPVDVGFYRYIIGTSAGTYLGSRLTGTGRLESSNMAAEATDGSFKWDYMNGWFDNSFSDTNYVGYNFKRAAGCIDAVAYTGTGSNRTLTHNLSIAPEMMWVKNRTDSEHWAVYHKHYGGTHWANLNELDGFSTSSTIWNNTNTTASVFTVGTASSTNQSNKNYTAYLFGSVDGVSKVGSYTGNGSTQTIDCGFSAGARFVLIKKSSEYGLYMVFDSFRGIVSGDSPYFNLNDTSAQVTNTDKIDPAASGFAVNVGDGYQSDANESGQTYIFLAIA